jgi:hypothetical protein
MKGTYCPEIIFLIFFYSCSIHFFVGFMVHYCRVAIGKNATVENYKKTSAVDMNKKATDE